MTLGKGLKDVQVWGGNQSFSVLKHKRKIGDFENFLYDSYNIAKHISVKFVLSLFFVLNQKFKKI